jgi:hypothetical protein
MVPKRSPMFDSHRETPSLAPYVVKLSTTNTCVNCRAGGLVVSILASGTQVRGFKPEKILSMPSFGGEVKPSVPRRSFAACKRSLNGVENASFRQNYRTPVSPTVPPYVTRSARVVGDVEASGGESGNV